MNTTLRPHLHRAGELTRRDFAARAARTLLGVGLLPGVVRQNQWFTVMRRVWQPAGVANPQEAFGVRTQRRSVPTSRP